MSNPTDNFSSDLDPYDRLAQMFSDGLFRLLPLPPSWANYVRAQYAPDPSLFSAPPSATPGFDKSPAVPEAIAAADSRPAGFYRSPMFAGVGTTTPGFRPLPTTQIGDTPGFDKSPAVLEALAKVDPRSPGFYGSPAPLGASATAPSLDSNLTAAVSPQETLFDRPGLSPMSLPPLPPSWRGVTPVSFPPPPSPPPTGDNLPADQSSPVTPANSPPTDVPNVTPAPATGPEPPSTVGRSGVAPSVEPPSNSLEIEQEFQKWPGQIVRRPDGLPVLDPTSPTGYLMSPFSDLSDVAAAGRRLGVDLVLRVFDDPRKTKDYAKAYLNHYVGQGGTFDYQRRAYLFGKDGLTQLKQFRNVSNFNVGVLTQQAGLPLTFVLWLAGDYAAEKSNNYKPDQPFGLDPPTREWIEEGYRASARGAFDSSRKP